MRERSHCSNSLIIIVRSCSGDRRPSGLRTGKDGSAAGRVKGTFPGFLPKTDETRVQVLESVLERHRRKVFYVTEKLDGTSFTAFIRDD